MLKLFQNLIKKKSISRAIISGRFKLWFSSQLFNLNKKNKESCVKNLKLKRFCLSDTKWFLGISFEILVHKSIFIHIFSWKNPNGNNVQWRLCMSCYAYVSKEETGSSFYSTSQKKNTGSINIAPLLSLLILFCFYSSANKYPGKPGSKTLICNNITWWILHF